MKLPSFKSIFQKDDAPESVRKQTKQNRNLRLLDDQRENTLPEAQSWANEAWDMHGEDISGATITALTSGSKGNESRSRHQIYQQWRLMERDPVISIALKTHVVAALGGHESKGDVIFIEDNPLATEEDKKILEEIRSDLLETFNRIAFSIAYNGVAFGDSYARTYYKKGEGLVRCIVDEMVHPTLIIPYEQGGNTVGFLAGNSHNHLARLTTLQLARLKMPRVAWVPQMGVLAKAYRYNILEDDIDKLPKVPAMVGGSLLFSAEKPFNDFYLSLIALVGQRWVDSTDESIVTVNMTGGTKEQQAKFKENIIKTLQHSKELAEKAMRGEPQFSRVRHVLFTHQEKQLTTHGETLGARRQGAVSIDDIMLHARLLAGALGIDLSMLGFADQLSGGLGDGGFFRMSAQIAEWSRLIRVAMSNFYTEMIDLHMLFKYGKKWEKGKRPFAINFYGSISAFESERQRTRADAVNSAGVMTQTMDSLKNLGLNEQDLKLFLVKQMLLDDDEADVYAKALSQAAQQTEEQGF